MNSNSGKPCFVGPPLFTEAECLTAFADAVATFASLEQQSVNVRRDRIAALARGEFARSRDLADLEIAAAEAEVDAMERVAAHARLLLVTGSLDRCAELVQKNPMRDG